MLILGVDTSGKNGSIALVRCEAESLRILEVLPLQGGTFSAQLMPQIAALLSQHKLTKHDIDAFAVVSGPGSFTGLRVGLAAIKALAEILQKPIAAVSLLEVIAFEASLASHASRNGHESAPLPNGLARSGSSFLIALDAGHNEVFVGKYKSGPELPTGVSESLLTFGELAEPARKSRHSIFTPDESVIQNLSSRSGTSDALNPIRVDRPNAVSVARLGYQKILAGQTVSPEQLDATYVRRADAEIKKPIRTPA
jgi:tRNA threonylcarbamoyladenosine biosynthesis protein TsaB